MATGIGPEDNWFSLIEVYCNYQHHFYAL
jgi:hypothetical protein